MPSKQIKCCEVENVFGYSLKQGVSFVGFISIITSICTLLTSLSTVLVLCNKEILFNSNSVNAVNMIFALFFTSTSLYQLVVSIMLLWFALWHKGTSFVLSLWFVSHMSLLTLYGFMFIARAAVCFHGGFYVQALFTIIGGVIYEGAFIYFAIIVNSYLISLEPDIIYY